MMKNVFKKISMMLVGAAMVLPSQAQLLKVVVPDKALRTQTSIPWQRAWYKPAEWIDQLRNTLNHILGQGQTSRDCCSALHTARNVPL